MNYPQIISENRYTQDSKNMLDIEIATAPGATADVVKYINKHKRVTVPGFRPGKVPKQFMERAVGKEQLYLDRMVQEFNIIRTEKDIITATDPNLTSWNESADGSINFKVTVEIVPFFEISKTDYEGLEVERDEIDPALIEKRWGQYIESLQKQFGTKKPIEEAKEDCYASLSLLNDANVPELVLENKQVQINDRFLLPEVRDQIIGMTDGETKSFHVSFPSDYGAVALKDKAVQFEAKLESIKELILHEVSDELAKQTKLAENLDELKAKFTEAETASEQEKVNHVFELECMETLLRKIDLAIPQSLVNSEMESILRNRLRNIIEMGIPKEYAFKNLDYEVLRGQAKNRLAAALLFNKLLKQNEFTLNEISDETIKEEISSRADKSGVTVEELEKSYSTPESIETLKKELLYNRFVDDLVAKAKPIPRKPKEIVVEEATEESSI